VTDPTPGSPRRPRHLLDPNDLHAAHRRSQGSQHSLTRVQRWVMSVLAVTTILHLAGGLALVAILNDDLATSGRVGLNVLASVTGVLAIAAGFLIHAKRPFTPWLVLGLLPGVIGAWLTFS
jgi:predicted anti-sigma-YlaC factor YlaD